MRLSYPTILFGCSPIRYSVAAQHREREMPGREEIRQEEELRHRPCIACVKVPRLLQASAGQHSECRQGWGWLRREKKRVKRAAIEDQFQALYVAFVISVFAIAPEDRAVRRFVRASNQESVPHRDIYFTVSRANRPTGWSRFGSMRTLSTKFQWPFSRSADETIHPRTSARPCACGSQIQSEYVMRYKRGTRRRKERLGCVLGFARPD